MNVFQLSIYLVTNRIATDDDDRTSYWIGPPVPCFFSPKGRCRTRRRNLMKKKSRKEKKEGRREKCKRHDFLDGRMMDLESIFTLTRNEQIIKFHLSSPFSRKKAIFPSYIGGPLSVQPQTLNLARVRRVCQQLVSQSVTQDWKNGNTRKIGVQFFFAFCLSYQCLDLMALKTILMSKITKE